MAKQGVTGEASSPDPDALSSKGPGDGSYLGEYDENGVDVSMVRYMLRLSPLERLKAMEKHARDMATLHEYGRKHRQATARSNR